jgi:hypothetical protein
MKLKLAESAIVGELRRADDTPASQLAKAIPPLRKGSTYMNSTD